MNDKDGIVTYPEYFKGYRIARFKYTMLTEYQQLTLILHYLETYPLAN